MLKFELSDIPVQISTGKILIPMCSKNTFDGIKAAISGGSNDALFKIAEKLGAKDISKADLFLLLQSYVSYLINFRSEMGLELPFCPEKTEEKDKIMQTVYTDYEKLVADYANISVFDVDDISIMDYWILLHDSVIHSLAKSEKGKKYLKDAYILTCEDADVDDIVKDFGG